MGHLCSKEKIPQRVFPLTLNSTHDDINEIKHVNFQLIKKNNIPANKHEGELFLLLQKKNIDKKKYFNMKSKATDQLLNKVKLDKSLDSIAHMNLHNNTQIYLEYFDKMKNKNIKKQSSFDEKEEEFEKIIPTDITEPNENLETDHNEKLITKNKDSDKFLREKIQKEKGYIIKFANKDAQKTYYSIFKTNPNSNDVRNEVRNKRSKNKIQIIENIRTKNHIQ